MNFNPQTLMQMLMQRNPAMMQQFQQFQQMFQQNPQMQKQYQEFKQQVDTNPNYRQQVMQEFDKKINSNESPTEEGSTVNLNGDTTINVTNNGLPDPKNLG